MNRDRPYEGQEHTHHGERGKQEVHGVTMRDVVDCYVRACCLSAGGGMSENGDRLYDQADRGEAAALSGADLFNLPWDDMDPIAISQNLVCEIERMMGIFPNLPAQDDAALATESGA